MGIGASAGGLDAFRALLAALPADTGMAFVLVHHLDPRHESILSDLLAPTTRIPVREVRGDTRAQPDQVYIIPPTADLALEGDVLRLVPRSKTDGTHMPIDFFFRSLAKERGSRGIGVVLSGTGTDGTRGLKSIKAEGGIAFAQDPRSAKFDSMPRSAIGSGCVDFVLEPPDIARELKRLGRHPYLGDAQGVAEVPVARTALQQDEERAFQRILSMLRRTGADFRSYKQATIKRRIGRRMALNPHESLQDYARHLESSPEELRALSEDCLITVTSFFRDPEVFEALSEQVIPRLIERAGDVPVRVWVAGCATGEEVYSIAMALMERANEASSSPTFQIFATDLSESALERARAGIYHEMIAHDVSPERLRRFFTPVDGHQQIVKSIREMCVFARHDMTAQPPFSRMDLISCRNLLIYLDQPLQEKALATFHYALNPGGFLMLGNSESVGPGSSLFGALDKKHKLFIRRSEPSELPPFARAGDGTTRAETDGAAAGRGPRAALRAEIPREADRILLSRYAPAAVIVSESLKILEFRGDTQPYLEHGQGEASLDLLKLIRRPLFQKLNRTILDVQRSGASCRAEDLPIRYQGELRKVTLEVIPLKGAAAAPQRCLLVLFEASPGERRPPGKPAGRKPRRTAPDDGDGQVAALKQELVEITQQLQAVMQEHQAASDELQSSNEEILSSNEELQSVNEELETAKEEVQSSNEELSTLNQELQDRNLQLAQLNDDLLNLLGAIDIPVVMVGQDMRLRRFTAAAVKLLNLIPADVGRPIGDLRSNLEAVDLHAAVAEVLDTMTSLHREVRDRQGRFYTLTVRPYRTRENKLDGALVVLLDIDALKRSAAEIQKALDHTTAIVETVREPLVILDPVSRVDRANRAFYQFFQVTPEETVGRGLFDLGNRQWDLPALREALAELHSHESTLESMEVSHNFPIIGRKTMVLNARRLHVGEDAGKVLLAIEDRTDLKRAELAREALLASEHAARERAETADRSKDDLVAMVSHELRGPLSAVAAWLHVLRRAPDLDRATLDHALDAIERSVKAQGRLISDLMEHSRIVAGKLSVTTALVDLSALMESAVETVRPTALAKGLGLELSILPAGVSHVVYGDVSRLDQVAWNLLTNAVKFTPRDGRIQVEVGRVGGHVQVTVADSGEGLDETFLPHVFDRYSQGSGVRKQFGLGLGLTVVSQIVELHGGTIEAESPGIGKGSTFRVKLPVPILLANPPAEDDSRQAGVGRGVDAKSTEPGGSDPIQTTPGPLDGLRVLVVEGDPGSRQVVTRVLERFGAKVIATDSGGAALEALALTGYDVLLSAIDLADQAGYELIRRVRMLPPESGGQIPAIALTASADERDLGRALEAGFQRHFVKPATPEELVEAIVQLGPRDVPI